MGISKRRRLKPFSKSQPFIWIGDPQRAVLQFLGEQADGALKVVIAPPLFGKTTCLTLYADACDQALLRASASASETESLLDQLAAQAGVSRSGDDEQKAQGLLQWIGQQRSENRRVQIAIDDAHLLGPDEWLTLQQLRTLKADGHAAAEIILFGQPKLVGSLANEGLETIDKRIHVIRPPTGAEVVDYIAWQLRSTGINQRTFSEPAAKLIARVAGGRLPVVDNLCRLALVGWKAQDGQTIDIRRVEAALSAMQARKKREEGSEGGAEALPLQGEMVLTRDGDIVARFPLGKQVTIGRSEDNDIVLDDPEIADRHASVIATPQGYKIVDLDSQEGLRVFSDANYTMLFDRDVIKLGSFDLKFLASAGPKHAEPLVEGRRRGAPHLRRIK